MKLLDMAFKDLRLSFRSLSGIMFMFVIPILVTGLFFFMFGGADAGDEDSFSLPKTEIILVNLDEGGQTGASEKTILLGDMLVNQLSGKGFADLLSVRLAEDAATARRAVDAQGADVAIILPPNFTSALIMPEGTAVIELYQDPALTIGPAVVSSIIRQFADNFSTAKLGTNVILTQINDSGHQADLELIQDVVNQFTSSANSMAEPASKLITISPPTGVNDNSNLIASILGPILGGMMIFFAFNTGSAVMQSILTEDEEGTLARLFTTPTPIQSILGGKVLAAFLTLVVQIGVLMGFGLLVFKIDWGAAMPVITAAAGIIVTATATGLLLVSFLKNSRQGGIVYGGVLTLTGMIGLITVFTGGSANVSPLVRTVSLFVPQGWAVRGLQISMNGGTTADILPTLAGLLIWSLTFAFIGQYRLQRRFA